MGEDSSISICFGYLTMLRGRLSVRIIFKRQKTPYVEAIDDISCHSEVFSDSGVHGGMLFRVGTEIRIRTSTYYNLYFLS